MKFGLFSRRYLPSHGIILSLVVATILFPMIRQDTAALRASAHVSTAPNSPQHGLRVTPLPRRNETASVYVAGPLFSAAERQFNQHLAQTLKRAGYTVILPQELTRSIANAEKSGWQQKIFDLEVSSLRSADAVICILDGADVDSGTAWEIGVAWQLRKPVVGLRTDFRTLGSEGQVNLMIQKSCRSIASEVPLAVSELERATGGAAHVR